MKFSTTELEWLSASNKSKVAFKIEPLLGELFEQ